MGRHADAAESAVWFNARVWVSKGFKVRFKGNDVNFPSLDVVADYYNKNEDD